MMNAEECNKRAAHCAANADMSSNDSLCNEYLALAAQWRSLAVREIYLGMVAAAAEDAPSNTANDQG